jgi:hypothetical protein
MSFPNATVGTRLTKPTFANSDLAIGPPRVRENTGHALRDSGSRIQTFAAQENTDNIEQCI